MSANDKEEKERREEKGIQSVEEIRVKYE